MVIGLLVLVSFLLVSTSVLASLHLADGKTIEALREEVDLQRAERSNEGEKYMGRAMRYEDRISELIRQNQNLAERIASLRLTEGVTGGEDFHVEEPSTPDPYSPELQELFLGIESEEARTATEEFIEARRAAGVLDEDILREIEDEWTR